MTTTTTTDLLDALRATRESVLWKLDGLTDQQVRTPVTHTGTNLLGLVKHLTTVELLYLGFAFDRSPADPPSWMDPGAPRGADLWATEDETRATITGAYRSAWAHADATVAELGPGSTTDVPWVPFLGAGVSLHRVLVHVLGETLRHAGHADILRESLDQAVGKHPAEPDLGDAGPDGSWAAHRARLERAAGVGR